MLSECYKMLEFLVYVYNSICLDILKYNLELLVRKYLKFMCTSNSMPNIFEKENNHTVFLTENPFYNFSIMFAQVLRRLYAMDS